MSEAHRLGQRIEPTSLAEWTQWLDANHDTADGIWLVTHKKATGRQACTYEEAVIEALRVGWVDSKGRALDAERSMLWFTRRRPGSGWSRPNKIRIDLLDKQGRLHPAGKAVIDAAKADGSWTLLDDVEALVVPLDLVDAFDRHPGSATHWEAFPPSARRAVLQWIVQAKRPDTRAKRIEETASLAAENIRANQWPRS